MSTVLIRLVIYNWIRMRIVGEDQELFFGWPVIQGTLKAVDLVYRALFPYYRLVQGLQNAYEHVMLFYATSITSFRHKTIFEKKKVSVLKQVSYLIFLLELL